MTLPRVNNINVASLLDRAELVRETAKQIIKDFGMFGVEITFSGDTLNAYDELHKQLINQITTLVERNYELLMSILYQVDITNKEMVQAEQELPHYSHIELIAHQVIARDLKKVLLRQYFKTKDKDNELEMGILD